MNGWTLAKYALALAGVTLVITGDRTGQRWLGYPGLVLVVVAFALRFIQRRRAARPDEEPPTA